MQDADYLRIPLRRRDRTVADYALIDHVDAALAESRWHLDNNGYARRVDRGRVLLLHRVVLGLEKYEPRRADHINRDKLDNRRANLRVVTHSQNMQNLGGRAGAASPFRGVVWAVDKDRWRARIGLDGKYWHIGYFRREIDAALAVEAWRREHMPFATRDPELTRIVEAVA